MARAKIVDTSATGTPNERDSEEIVDPFEYFSQETAQVVINIRRLEPAVIDGQVVSGWLPSKTLSPQEAQSLATVLSESPGCGGGLYLIQHLRQKATGGVEFGKSFRFRVAGPHRCLEWLHAKKETRQAALDGPTQQQMPGNAYWPPPPWYGAQPPAPAMPTAGSPTMAELPRLLESLAGIVRMQPQAAASAAPVDVVQMVQALQRAVQPEDELSKFAKFAKMMDTIRGEPATPAASGIDWGAAVLALKEVLKPTPPQMAQNRSNPPAAPRVPLQVPPPPGWRWDGAQWVKNTPMADIPPPPGWAWNGKDWSRVADASDAAPKETSENRGDENEDEDEAENEDEGDEEAEQMTADEMVALFGAMAPEEREKLAAMYATLAQ